MGTISRAAKSSRKEAKMIINDLYPNGSSWYTGRTYQQYQDFLAQNAGTFGFDGYSPDAYYMGWISADNLDVAMRHSEVEVDDTVYKFTDDTNSENFPVGYVYNPQPSYNFMENGECIKKQDDTYSTIYTNLAFVNQWYPEFSGQYYSCNAYFIVKISDAGGNYVSSSNVSNVQSMDLNLYTPRDTYKFLYLNIPVTVNLGSTYGSFTFNSEELDENGTLYKETSTGYFARLFFISYVIGNYTYVYHQNSPTSLSVNFKPFATISYANGSYSRCFTGNAWNYGAIYMRNYQNNGRWMHDNTGNGYGGWRPGMDGTIDISLLSSITPYMWDGNVLAEWRQYSGSLFEVDFKCICTRKDFKRAFSMQFRLDFNTYTMSYVNGVTYATDVTSQNEFLAQLKTGDIEDTAFKNSLRPWQYENFQSDEFEPEDVPPYTPGGGGDRPDPEIFPDDENVGDDIDTPDSVSIGSTLGFITQYCLNAAQIAELGELLWTSFVDPDYWKNFMFSLALDTGSFNTSALLDFFISLRVYPFPLVNAPGYRAMGNNMYVGTGTVALEFNNPLHAINSYAVIIDAGKLKIPFCFGDFRDCTNMEVILYLPYCGTVQLESNDVLGGELHAKYCVDLATGSCTAIVDLTTWDNHKYPIAVLSGSIGADVPMSATNAGQVAARLGSDVLNTAGILISGAAGIADAAKTIAAGVVMENPLIAGAGAAQIVGTEAKTAGGLAKQGLDMVSRPGIGAPMLSGGRGFSAAGVPQKCYIQIRHPFYKKPANYDSTEANPAAVQIQVSSCSGLCSFVNPDVSSITATEEEKNQIRALLQAGIII